MSAPIRSGPSVSEDLTFEVENLPALLKELDDAAGVADGVESKLDILLAQLEALENNLEARAHGTEETRSDSPNVSLAYLACPLRVHLTISYRFVAAGS